MRKEDTPAPISASARVPPVPSIDLYAVNIGFDMRYQFWAFAPDQLIVCILRASLAGPLVSRLVQRRESPGSFGVWHPAPRPRAPHTRLSGMTMPCLSNRALAGATFATPLITPGSLAMPVPEGRSFGQVCGRDYRYSRAAARTAILLSLEADLYHWRSARWRRVSSCEESALISFRL